MARVVARWLTSSQLSAVRMPFHDAGTGLVGRALGSCQRGRPFVFDPFDAYNAGLVANPNILVTGAIGVGKSTVVKMLVTRGLDRGHGAVVLDPKGEYRDLATLRDGRVIHLGTSDASWCNPFTRERRDDLALVDTLVGASLQRSLADDERFVLETAWDAADASDAPRPLRALFGAVSSHLDDDSPSASRTVAYSLRRFVDGDLAGLFDGDDDPEELNGDLTVLDLSSAWHSESAAIVALAAMAIARRALSRRRAAGYLVVDEAWAVLADPRVAHWLHGSWKLARARATSHVLVLHRWSDAFAAADEGTAQRAKVTGILRDCDTVVLMRQDAGERQLLDTVLQLRAREESYALSLPRGVALVRYGAHRSVVRLEPDVDDQLVIDTDHAMRPT